MSYTNRILTEPGYQDIIRDKIGLATEVLPDSKIDRMDGVELAETIIIQRVPDYSSLAGDNSLYLKMATVFCVCALLAKDFGQGILRSERLPDYQYENFQIDMKQREKDFWEKADEFLCKISTYAFPEKKLVEALAGYAQDNQASQGSSSPY